MEDNIVLSKEEYEKLMKEIAFLRCLEMCGVDNWQGYSFAWEMMETEYGYE